MSNQNNTSLITSSPKDDWVLLQKQCKAFIASGFLPDHVVKGVSPEVAMAKAITIVMKGRELGIPPMQAFSSIAVISGKPCLSAELMLALIYKHVKGAKVTFRTPPEKQSTECVVEMQRPDGEPQLFRFTIQDAQTAGIVRDNGPWKKFPAAMLRARAISAGARAVFPDCIMGAYTPEELGGEIIEGEIVAENVTTDVSPPVRNQTTTSHGDWDRANVGWEEDPATEKQIARLHALGKTNGFFHADLKNLAFDIFKKNSLEELTKSEIQIMFVEIEAKPVVTKTKLGSVEDIRQTAKDSH